MPVGLEPGQQLGAGAGGDDDLGGGHGLPRGLNPDGLLREQLAPALDHLDPVLTHQEGHPVHQLGDDLPAAGDGGAEIGSDLASCDAELIGLLEQPKHVGVAQQRLGGDAAPVEADAAQSLALLDHGDRHPQLGRPNGGDVAAGARSDDGQILHG